MKKIILFLISLSILALFGCTTIKENATEPKARDAAQWVKTRAGFIENAVAAITHVAVYSSEEDSNDRLNTLLVMHALSKNINAVVSEGKVDADSIREALKINEPVFGPLFESIAQLAQSEINNFKQNGYGDLTIEILKAVSKGVSDGTVQ